MLTGCLAYEEFVAWRWVEDEPVAADVEGLPSKGGMEPSLALPIVLGFTVLDDVAVEGSLPWFCHCSMN